MKPTQRIGQIFNSVSHVVAAMSNPRYERRMTDPEACDFLVGNPQDMPLAGYVSALHQHTPPQNKDWFGYKMNEDEPRKVLAENLSLTRGVSFRPENIFMTTGAFAGLAVSLYGLLDPGDEVIFISPPWFFYEALILMAGGVPKRVKCDPVTFDLDLEVIESTITPRTKAVLVNSPNNPTGRIYPEETLKELSDILTRASQKNNSPIMLLSDEAYNRIVYDGVKYMSPVHYYPHSLLIYTYGKTLLTPGQRIGYVALSPDFPEPDSMRQSILLSQVVLSYAFPNAVLQYAIRDLEKLSIDIEHLQQKRDKMFNALKDIGYQIHKPEGTFYLLPRSPIEDDVAFVDSLTDQHVYCLPGKIVEMPGYFRISLTANDDMLDRSLPIFKNMLEKVGS